MYSIQPKMVPSHIIIRLSTSMWAVLGESEDAHKEPRGRAMVSIPRQKSSPAAPTITVAVTTCGKHSLLPRNGHPSTPGALMRLASLWVCDACKRRRPPSATSARPSGWSSARPVQCKTHVQAHTTRRAATIVRDIGHPERTSDWVQRSYYIHCSRYANHHRMPSARSWYAGGMVMPHKER
jgi:hypothetical protein